MPAPWNGTKRLFNTIATPPFVLDFLDLQSRGCVVCLQRASALGYDGSHPYEFSEEAEFQFSHLTLFGLHGSICFVYDLDFHFHIPSY